MTDTRNNHSTIAPKFKKLSLPKNSSQDDVEIFSQAFKVYFADNSVDQVVINRRAINGKGAGGAGTFLIEGMLLAIYSGILYLHLA